MPPAGKILRGTLVLALSLVYLGLAHYTIVTPGMETVGAMLALGPILLMAATLAWRSAHRAFMLSALVAICALLLAFWSRIELEYTRIYWIEHAGTQLFLSVVFARTLVSARIPLCTHFARMVHGTLTPEVERYTRQVTLAWALFFGAMSAVSTVLFFGFSVATWSMFSYFLTGPLIAAMFVAEYAVRRHLHPGKEHARFLDAIKGFWKAPVA